jgi:hypothetical protein
MIGTTNNIERTGDRDSKFSDLMREPKGVRVCDIDLSPICPNCKYWIVLFEAKRDPGALIDNWVWSHSEYTRNTAKKLGIRAYMLYSWNGQWDEIEIIHLDGGFKREKLSRQQFIDRIERTQEIHKCEVQ